MAHGKAKLTVPGRLLLVQRIELEGAAAEAWDRFIASSPAGDLVQTAVWGLGKQATGYKQHG